jgi:hypothetical protein
MSSQLTNHHLLDLLCVPQPVTFFIIMCWHACSCAMLHAAAVQHGVPWPTWELDDDMSRSLAVFLDSEAMSAVLFHRGALLLGA